MEPTLAGEDFAFFANLVPAAIVFVGNNDVTAGSGAALHNPGFKLDEELLPLGSAYLAQLALDFASRWGSRSGAAPSRDEL